MTVKLLQLVNSAFFGFSRKVCNPSEAVNMLGIATVRSLAVSIHAFSCFEQSKVAHFSIGQMWNHSLHTGSYAQKIAQSARVGQGMGENDGTIASELDQEFLEQVGVQDQVDGWRTKIAASSKESV